jgi:hypothetical protein
MVLLHVFSKPTSALMLPITPNTYWDPFEGSLRNSCAIGTPRLQSRKDFGAPPEAGSESMRDWIPGAPKSRKDFGAPVEGGSEIFARLKPRGSSFAKISEHPYLVLLLGLDGANHG